MSEFEVVTGSPPPVDAQDMVLVNHGGDWIWSRSSLGEIDLIAGGDGICEIEPVGRSAQDGIVPQDGAWRGTVRVRQIAGCLPQVAEMVPPLVETMATLRQIAWGGQFHPARFASGGAPAGIRWTQRSPTQFDGVFLAPANGALEVKITATATLTAPDRAEATLALRLGAAKGANAAALARLGMAECQADAVHDFERVGP